MVWYVSSLSSHVPSVNAMLFHNQCSVSKDHSEIVTQLSLSQNNGLDWYIKKSKTNAKLSETSVVLIDFNDVSAYTVIVSFCRSTWIRYQKCLIRSMTNTDPLYNCSKSHNCRINYDIYNMKLHVFLHFNLSCIMLPFLYCVVIRFLLLNYYTINDFYWGGYKDLLTQEHYIYRGQMAEVNILFLG